MWSQHDPTYLLPIVVMMANYFLITKSEHPFLINVRKDWSPLSRSFLCLYGSAMFIVLPQSYSIAYLSFLISHFIIRELRRKPCLDIRF